MVRKFYTAIFFLFTSSLTYAQVSADYAVQVTATTTEIPPSITLHWNLYAGATSYLIYRKAEGATSWGVYLASYSGDSLEYKDSDVQLDSLYEYRVLRSGNGISANGYLSGAIKLNSKDYKGYLLLVVDSAVADSLQTELFQFMKDVSNDGWGVKRIDVSTSDSVPGVKALIKAEFTANPELKSVLLFGHVPVPYSGELNPDGHPDHLGAWPADAFYGEMNADWSDDYIDISTASNPANFNTPGDGKFDATYFPDDIDLQIGRVDLSNLPAFPESEITLLRRYLNKDHNYRMGNFTVQSRGLVDDNFGAFGGEAFASNGFRNFAPLMGDSSTDEVDYFTTLTQQSYLWSYGCGGGWYQGAGGVGSTSDFVNDTVKTVFTMLFGSYFGDWNNSDDFLRAPLASKGFTLTDCWAGRPYWFFHYMALGENIGYCAKLTQNNSYLYPGNYGTYWVHIALMGDPTLRMYVIKPPTNVQLANNSNGDGVAVTWNNSPDAVLGYFVYRSSDEFGKYDRVSNNIVTTQPFIDVPVTSGNYFYVVRAVRLEETPSGTFYNLSEGDVDSMSVNITGIEEQNSVTPSFSLYPNPVTDRLIILFSDNTIAANEIYITDILGKEIMHQTPGKNPYAVLNVSALAAGMYVVRTGTAEKKFVKQ